jgi:hypothetical protein
MPKNIRVRTKVGQDQVVTINLEQDFDMLEILSLNMHQTDVYRRDCADFGVLVGRVVANSGFGLPNAKVSVFIPLDEEDSENEIIRTLYPFTSPSVVSDDGYRYNLLPQDPSYTGHVPTGSFPKLSDVLLNQEVSYVYQKYYKLTVKTNDSGDFMIYGVPLGSQRVVMNIDLSDMGCFSMVPEDFKIQGFPDSKFDGAKFKSGTELQSLPQIVQIQKQVEIYPFWGDDNAGCGASITRLDFDLRELGIEIKPTSVFMGSIGTDTEKESVNKNCRPRKTQGNLCNIVPTQGTIESIRFTPFFKEENNQIVPVLERFDIDGGFTIDENGAFLINVPMNIDFLITNEFGEQEISQDPTVGVPTKGKYRFRISPLESQGQSRLRYRGSYLVPNIREYNNNGGSGQNSPNDPPGFQYNGIEKTSSYAFSVDYFDYPQQARDEGLILTAQDYFYEFQFGKVYTVSQFIDFWKNRNRDSFIGVKEIFPPDEESCDRTPFPINDGIRNSKFRVILTQTVVRLEQILYTTFAIFIGTICPILQFLLAIVNLLLIIACIPAIPFNILTELPLGIGTIFEDLFDTLPIFGDYLDFCDFDTGLFGTIIDGGINSIFPSCCQIFGCLKLRITKYPDCQKCRCQHDLGVEPASLVFGSGSGSDSQPLIGNCSADDDDGNDDVIECSTPNSGPQINGTCGDGKNVLENGCYILPYTGVAAGLIQTLINVIIGFLNLIGGLLGFGELQLLENFSFVNLIEQISQWRRREVIARSLCDGIVNYSYSNNWVNGFLYHFQFKGKVKPDEDSDTGFRAKFCAKILHFDRDSNKFYYRSCPTNLNGQFIGDPDGSLTNENQPNGANFDDILFPTTIIELGSRSKYINEICSLTSYRDGCSISSQLSPTTFNSPGEFMFDSVNELVTSNSSSLFFTVGSIFPREEKRINGSIAGLLSEFSELGVIEYNSLSSDDLDDLVDGVFNLDELGVDYAPAGWYTSPSGQYPTEISNDVNQPPPNNAYSWPDLSVSVLGGNSEFVFVKPRILQDDEVIDDTLSGQRLRFCFTQSFTETSQTVPTYLWRAASPSQELSDWVDDTNGIVDIKLQDISTWSQYGSTPLNSSDYNGGTKLLGSGYHFYFGLIPGATAYDIFVNKYVPIEE